MRISDWSSDVCSSDLYNDDRPDAGHGRTGAPRGSTEGIPRRARVDARRAEPTHRAAQSCPFSHHYLIRSEEHTSELQSLMRISYAVFCLKKQKNIQMNSITIHLNHNDIHIHITRNIVQPIRIIQT